MLPESIELVVVTPERQLLRESVTEVTLPGAGGCLGVLPGHAPLITELGIGELTYRKKGHFTGRELYFHDPSGNRLELRDPTWKAGMPEPPLEEIVRS